MYIEGPEKVIYFHQKNPIGIAWGNFIQGYVSASIPSIYISVRVSSNVLPLWI